MNTQGQANDFQFSRNAEFIEELKKIPRSEALKDMRLLIVVIVLLGFFIMLIGNGDLGIFGRFIKKLVVFYFIFFFEFILFIVFFPQVSRIIIHELIGLLI
jgi:hypothetical protein